MADGETRAMFKEIQERLDRIERIVSGARPKVQVKPRIISEAGVEEVKAK